jgi:DNA polymerase-3 subunit delta'
MGLDHLIGNNRIKNILHSYLRNDNIPYSMLFAGAAAANTIGFATAFAKAIQCQERDDDFCGACRHCEEIDKEIFPDLKIISPEGQFYKKEQIIFLKEDNYRRPMSGKKKIFIVKDAQKMNENSANAFLKVLEEPAESTMFILLTKNLNNLLPTIKSRCQILNFTLPTPEELKAFFLSKGIDESQAELLSYLGQSGMEDVVDGNYDDLMQKRDRSLDILVKLSNKTNVDEILLDLNTRSRSRDKFLDYFTELVNLLSLLLRDIMLLHIEEESGYIINIDYKETLMNLRQQLPMAKVLYLVHRMELLFRDIHRNLNTKVLILEFIKSYTLKEVNHV